MSNLFPKNHQIKQVSSFQELISTPFQGDINAICWNRNLIGNFEEIISQVKLEENLIELNETALLKLELSEQGQLAREIILKDMMTLKTYGAAPVLNIIKRYEQDDAFPFFPTDVYSFHVDRSPIPTDTFLCTYLGVSSEIIPNADAEQKVLIPKIRAELQKLYDGPEEGFVDFLEEYFFDLHYQAQANTTPINLGLGNLWKLAVDHPKSKVLPCIHRAPKEEEGQKRLLLIC